MVYKIEELKERSIMSESEHNCWLFSRNTLEQKGATGASVQQVGKRKSWLKIGIFAE
jgi:hypothetical protein